jgi:hypothetical protein
MIVAYLTLALGCMGLAGCAGAMMQTYTPGRGGAIVCLPICVPLLTVLTITYFKQPFLSPRTFCFCLLFAMGWFALLAVAINILSLLGYMPPESPKFARSACLVFANVGWVSFVPLIRLHRVIRRHESSRNP